MVGDQCGEGRRKNLGCCIHEVKWRNNIGLGRKWVSTQRGTGRLGNGEVWMLKIKSELMAGESGKDMQVGREISESRNKIWGMQIFVANRVWFIVRMEMMVIRVEVIELTSNSWIIHLTYMFPRKMTGSGGKEDWKPVCWKYGWIRKYFLYLVPILHTDRIWLNTAMLCRKICKDYSTLICCFAPSKRWDGWGHREELSYWEMDGFLGLSFLFFVGGSFWNNSLQ